jgi:precorrin-6x reductase
MVENNQASIQAIRPLRIVATAYALAIVTKILRSDIERELKAFKFEHATLALVREFKAGVAFLARRFSYIMLTLGKKEIAGLIDVLIRHTNDTMHCHFFFHEKF